MEMPMTQWTLAIPDDTDRRVQRYLADTGSVADLSDFVDQAVRTELLRRTVRSIQDRNADLSPEEADALADEAVKWARANPS